MKKITENEILNIKDDDKIQEYLFNIIYQLGEAIIKTRNIKHNFDYKDNDKYLELYSMSEDIYYNSVWFDSYRFLAKDIRYWNSDDEFEYENTIEYKVKKIVKRYNELIDEINSYKKQNEKIQKEGFDKLENELVNNLHNLFCQMLDYKKRKYDKNASIFNLIEESKLCYADYKYMFDRVYTMLKGYIYKDTVRDDFWRVPASHVEIISSLNFIYHFFNDEPDNYKNYRQFYSDITLKEGQTLKDLYSEEQEKMRLLFIEMLEFLHIPLDDNKTYGNLESLVKKNYPYYYYNFLLDANEYSYIRLIDIIRKNYKYFKETYKNHDKDLERYNKEREECKNNEKDYEIEFYDEEDNDE